MAVLMAKNLQSNYAKLDHNTLELSLFFWYNWDLLF